MRLETLILELAADTTNLDRVTNQAIDKIAAKLKNLENRQVSIKAPLGDLLALDRELIQKKKDYLDVVNTIKNNPLKVSVNYSQITAARKELKGLRTDLGGSSGTNTIRVQVEHKYKIDAKESNRDIANQIKDLGSGLKDIVKAVKDANKVGLGGMVTGAIGAVASVPMGIIRGVGAGIAQNATKQFSKGFESALNEVFKESIGSLEVLGDSFGKAAGTNAKNGLAALEKARKELNRKIAKSYFEDEVEMVKRAMADKDSGFNLSESDFNQYVEKAAAKYAGKEYIPSFNAKGFQKARKEFNSKIAKSMFEEEINMVRAAIDDKSNDFTMNEADYQAYVEKAAAKFAKIETIPNIAIPQIDINKKRRAQAIATINAEKDYQQSQVDFKESIKSQAKIDTRESSKANMAVRIKEQQIEEIKGETAKVALAYNAKIEATQKQLDRITALIKPLDMFGDFWGEKTGLKEKQNALKAEIEQLIQKRSQADSIITKQDPALDQIKKIAEVYNERSFQSRKRLNALLKQEQELQDILFHLGVDATGKQLPELIADKSMGKNGFAAAYGAMTNQMFVSPDTLAKINSGKLSSSPDQWRVVAHEMAHGADSDFGQTNQGLSVYFSNKRIGLPLNITEKELKGKLGSFNPNALNLEDFAMQYLPHERAREASAEIQARRASIKKFGLSESVPSEVVSSATDTGKQIGGAIIHALGQGAIATIKGSAGAIGQGIGAVQGLENFVLDVLPYGHGLKKLGQAGLVLGGLPMAAAAFPALAPVAGMMHGVQSLGAAGGSALATAHLGGVAGIPMIGGQVAGLLSGAAGGTAGIAAELLTATAGVKLVTKTIDTVVTKITGSKEASQRFQSNLQLAEVQASAIANELKKVSEGFKSVTGQMRANPQLAASVNRSAQYAQLQLKGAMAQLPASERMGDDPLAKELQAKLSMLERLRKASEKLFKQQGGNPKDLTIDVTATAVEIEKHWDKTEKSVAKNITELSKVSAVASYEIQHNLAEGSPGLTQNIRDYWDKTVNHIKGKVSELNDMRLENLDPELKAGRHAVNVSSQMALASGISAQSYTHMADATEALDRLEAKLFGTNRIRMALDLLDGGLQKVFSEVSKVWGILGRSPIGEFVGSLGKAAVSALGLFAIFKINMFVWDRIGKASFETARNVETLTRALNLTTDGKASQTLANIKKQADDLGTSYLASAEAYKNFSATTQGTALEERTPKMFEQAQRAMSARSMSGEEQKNAMIAISQMAGKGVISMEELRGQLAESFPGALQIAARAMGKTVPELNKLVESGQLLSEDFLPKFFNQMAQESSGSNNTADAAINRMNSQLERLQTNLGDPLLKAAKVGLPVVSSLLGAMADHGGTVSMTMTALSLVLAGGLVSGLVQAGQGLGIFNAKLTVTEVLMQKSKQAAFLLGKGLIQTAALFAVFKFGETMWSAFISENEDLKQSFADVTAEIKKFNAENNKINPPKKQDGNILGNILAPGFTLMGQSGNAVEKFQAMRQYGGGIFGDGNYGKVRQDIENQLVSTNKIYDGGNSTLPNRAQILAIRSKIKDSQLDANLALGEGDTQGNLVAIAKTNALKNQEEALIKKLYPDIAANRAILKDAQARKEDLLSKKDLLDPSNYNKAIKDLDDNISITTERLREYDQAIEEVTVEFQKMTTVSAQLANKLANNEFMRQEAGKDSSLAGKQAALKSGLAITSPSLMDAQLRVQQQQIDKARLQNSYQIQGEVNTNLLANLTPELNKRLSDKRLFGGNFSQDLLSGKISGEALSQVAGRKDLTPELQGVLQLAQQYLSVRTQIKNTEEQILDADIAIAQQQYNRSKEVRDFNRSQVDLAISIRDTLQGQQRQAEDMTIQIQDFKINTAREVRNFTESYQDFTRSLDKQLLEAQQQLETSQRNLSQQSLSNKVRGGLKGGGDSLIKGFLDLVDSQIQIENEAADNKKALNLQALDIEQQRLEITKQVRSMAEQGYDLEKSRFSQLLSMAMAQEDYTKQQQSTWLSVTRQVEDMRIKAKEMGFTWKGIGDTVGMIGDAIKDAYTKFQGIVDGMSSGSDSGAMGAGDIVSFGKSLQARGFSVGEHPVFGGVGKHAKNSYHYSGQAIDINADKMKGGEVYNLDKLYAELDKQRKELGIVELLWRTKGHYDHLHVAMGGRNESFYSNDSAIIATRQIASNLRANPRDLASLFSFESAGTFDPNKMGGTNNDYQGWIQFSADARKQYGVKRGQSIAQHAKAVERYLYDRLKRNGDLDNPSLENLYKAINPGFSATELKRRLERDGHWKNADRLLGSAPIGATYTAPSAHAQAQVDAVAKKYNISVVPSMNLNAAKAKADQVTVAKTQQMTVDAQLKTQENLRKQIEQADKLATFMQSIDDIGRGSDRQLANNARNVQDLILGDKGYLNIEETINKAVSDRAKQYSDQVQSLEDVNRAIDKQLGDTKKMAGLATEQIKTVKSAEQRKALENQLLKIQEVSGKLTSEKKNNEFFIDKLKQSQLKAEQATTKEQEKQFAIARQSYIESSSNELLNAQIGASTNPFEKQQLQMQANAAKVQQQLQKTMRDLNNPDFLIKNGLTAEDAAIEISKAEKIAQISLQTLNGQTDLVLGGMTNAFSGFFGGIFDSASNGFNNISDLLGNLGKSVLSMISNIFSQIAMDALMPTIKGVSGFLSGGLGGLFGFAMGSDYVPNYAGGIGYAVQRERAMSGGKRPYVAVLHQGESVLSTINRDAQLYRSLKASGTWDHLKAGNPVRNYANGTEWAMSSGSSYHSMGGNSQVINQNITVVTPNADSFRKSQAQINAEQAAAMRRTMKR